MQLFVDPSLAIVVGSECARETIVCRNVDSRPHINFEQSRDVFANSAYHSNTKDLTKDGR